MTRFVFKTDKKTENYCMLIASEMKKLFGVTEKEAIRRINIFWEHMEIIEEDDMIYHEMPVYWAEEIYYRYDS